MPMQGNGEPAQLFVFEELRSPEAVDSCFAAFSSRKPVSDLLENALAEKSGRRGWGTPPPFSLPTEGGVFHRKVAGGSEFCTRSPEGAVGGGDCCRRNPPSRI